jgi:hypothetical protein
MRTKQNVPAEISFEGCGETKLSVIFTAPDGTEKTVPAFFAGDHTWKVRYSSPAAGHHAYITVSEESSLNAISGQIYIDVYDGDNPLYRHGPVCRKNDNLYLSYGDGTPFFWLGDTWWMALTKRLDMEGFRTLTADRAAKGFTIAQIVAGLYPDMSPFDDRGANNAGFPWDENFTAVNHLYFNEADEKIKYLCENGIVPCIVGSWGFFMKFAGKETLKRHWDNLIARWAAYPVVWCLAGEANMTFYDSKVSHDEHLRASRRDWNDIALHVRGADPFGRLVTIHPTQNGHEQIDDESLLDLDMLQTGHASFLSIIPTLRQVKAALDRKKLPVINSEVCYEGIAGSSHADIQRFMFTACVLMGCCGHTYGANGIWQLNAPGCPYGVSPHGAGWGDTPWTEAYQLPGSSHIGRIKKFITQYDWHCFEPHQEWVESPNDLNSYYGHFAAGIPQKVRIIYKPFPCGDFWGSIVLRELEPGVRYRTTCYNPVTDETRDLGYAVPDENGLWRLARANAFGDLLFSLVAE